VIDEGASARERMLRSRQKALEQIREMSRKPVERGALRKQTLIHCANRIRAVDGDTEAVRLVLAAVNSGIAESREMLAAANELAKVQSAARRVHALRRTDAKTGQKIKAGWSLDNSAEGVLERLSLAAADKGAMLVRYSTGGIGVIELGSRLPKVAELLGVYDIRADARDMLADIKEAMA
jgi:hypothetical protein